MALLESRSRRRSLTDEVRDHIRDGIAEGRYRPGERLREGAIAEFLDVSRTPIREAMRILEAEGLIVIEPWKGITVAKLSRRQISEFYVYRELLEGLAAEMAAALVTDENVEQLDEMLLRLEEGREQSGSDLGSANEEFHQMIVDISGNRFLKQSLGVIDTAKILIWKPIYPSDKRWNIARKEHRKIFNALRARDPEAAKLAAEEHVRNSGLTRIDSILNQELEAQ